MAWKERLRALVLAGGALAAVGCDDTKTTMSPADMTAVAADLSYQFICNGNPDPCCLHPNMKGCPSDGGMGD
jgi:hypothetical protein